MSDIKIDVNDLVNSLLEQVSNLSRELAFARAQVTALQKSNEKEVEDN